MHSDQLGNGETVLVRAIFNDVSEPITTSTRSSRAKAVRMSPSETHSALCGQTSVLWVAGCDDEAMGATIHRTVFPVVTQATTFVTSGERGGGASGGCDGDGLGREGEDIIAVDLR